MQVPQQTVIQCPQPTHEQVQEQIAVNHWNEGQQQRQQLFNHQEAMAEKLVLPGIFLIALVIIAFVIVYLVRKEIAAGIEKNADDNRADIQKNKDDNAADVVRAREIIDSHESAD